MSIKFAAYKQIMNESGYTEYDPYLDPSFAKELDFSDVGTALLRALQTSAAIGGIGKTGYNLMTKGRLGTVAPIIGALGLGSHMLEKE